MLKSKKGLFLLLLVAVLGLTIFGCKSKKSKESSTRLEEEVMDMVEEEKIQRIMEEFTLLADKKDKSLGEKIQYIEENIEELDKENSDILISKLEELLIESREEKFKEVKDKNLTKKILELIGENNFIDEDKLQDSKDKELKDFIENLHNDYYKIMSLDGDIYLLVDYDKLLSYDKSISEDLKEYFSIMSKSTNDPVLCKGKLNITYDDLSKRLIKLETYIKKVKDNGKYEKMLRKYKDNLIIYLQGTKESPVVDIRTNKFNKESLSSYREVSKDKEHITSYLIRGYIDVIEENNMMMNDKVKKSILSLVNEGVFHLEDARGNDID